MSLGADLPLLSFCWGRRPVVVSRGDEARRSSLHTTCLGGKVQSLVSNFDPCRADSHASAQTTLDQGVHSCLAYVKAPN